MHGNSLPEITPRLLLLLFISLIGLAGCGGGGGGGVDGTVDSALKGTLFGTAATGAPLAGTVTVQDANGNETSALIDSDGAFTLDLDTMTPPFILRATPANGDPDLYSYSATLNTRVNITPLTHLAVFIGSDRGDLDSLYRDWSTSFSSLTGETLDQAQRLIRSNFQTQFAANGVDVAEYNFMVAEFVTDGSGIDGVLDSLRIRVDYATGEVSVSDSLGNPIVFNLNTVSDGLNHIAGPDLRFREGHINEYHAGLVNQVLRMIHALVPRQVEKALMVVNGPQDCDHGGSRSTTYNEPTSASNFTFRYGLDHLACEGAPSLNPLEGVNTLQLGNPFYDGELLAAGTYLDDLNQFGKTTATGLTFTWESPIDRTLLTLNGDLNFTRTGINSVNLVAPDLASTNPELRSVMSSDMFTQLGYGDYTEATSLQKLQISYDGGDITELFLVFFSSNDNQPLGYVLEVNLLERLEFMDPWQWRSGKLSIREADNLVPGVTEPVSELRVTYGLSPSGNASQQIEVDYNGNGVIETNDSREYRTDEPQL